MSLRTVTRIHITAEVEREGGARPDITAALADLALAVPEGKSSQFTAANGVQFILSWTECQYQDGKLVLP